MSKPSRRTVIEVDEDLHGEIRRLALLNDLKIYEVANAVLKEFLKSQDTVRALIKRLKLENRRTRQP